MDDGIIVTDTSALISLAIADTLGSTLEEFDVHTTQTVCDELTNTAEYDDSHGGAAQEVLEGRERVTIHNVENPERKSSRIDAGEASCLTIAQRIDAKFLITDDFRAFPGLQTLADAKVAISPIVLKALVKREVLEPDEAVNRLKTLAETRDWLGAPIYRRAQNLFEFQK